MLLSKKYFIISNFYFNPLCAKPIVYRDLLSLILFRRYAFCFRYGLEINSKKLGDTKATTE